MFYQSFKPLLDFRCPSCHSTQFQVNDDITKKSANLQIDQDGYYLLLPDLANRRTIHLTTAQIIVSKETSLMVPDALTIDCLCRQYSKSFSWTNHYLSAQSNDQITSYQATNIYLEQESCLIDDYEIVSLDLNNVTKFFHHNKLILTLQHYLPFNSPQEIQNLFLKLKTLNFYQ